MLGRVGARGAARHQQKRKEPVKQASWFLRRLHLESFDDEAEDDLHSTTTAFEVHVERFLAQLPNLHRRDLAREFFQLSRVRRPRSPRLRDGPRHNSIHFSSHGSCAFHFVSSFPQLDLPSLSRDCAPRRNIPRAKGCETKRPHFTRGILTPTLAPHEPSTNARRVAPPKLSPRPPPSVHSPTRVPAGSGGVAKLRGGR